MSYEFFESVSASGHASGTPQLLVQRSHERSSWVALPPSLASQLYENTNAIPLVVELRAIIQRAGISMPSDDPKYLAWGGACGSAGSIGIPAGVITSLGLTEGRPVVVRPLWDVPEAVSVTVEPANEDDWEIVELNAEYLEGSLLSQVGVVSPRQPFPFWVHTHLINLKVVAMDPASSPAARLVPGSEVHIAPRLRVRHGAVPAKASCGKQAQQDSPGGETCPTTEPPLETALRAQCVSDSLAASWAAQRAQQGLPPTVLPVGISPITLARCGLREGDWVRLESANSAASAPASAAGKFGSLAPCADVAVGHIAFTAQQCATFGVEPFSHVRLERLEKSQKALVLEAAELLQRQQQAAGATSGSGKAPPQAAIGSAAGEALLKGEDLQNGVQNGQLNQAKGPPSGGVSDVDLEAMRWLGDALPKAVQALLPVLGATPRCLLQSWGVPRPGGLLVSGPAGSGKSALLSAAATALQRHPQCLTYPVVVRCREITSEGSGRVQALISAKVREAIAHMPSLLIFDDLDMLCQAETDGPGGAGSRFDPGLVQWLGDVLDYLCTPAVEWGRLPSFHQEIPKPAQDMNESNGADSSVAGENTAAGSGNGGGEGHQRSNGTTDDTGSGRNVPVTNGKQALQQLQQRRPSSRLLWAPVAFAASCKDPAALAAPLRTAGRLDQCLSLPAPSAESRAAMLAAGVRARGAVASHRDLQLVAEKADGFDAADLEVLLDRAMHLALCRRLTTAPLVAESAWSLPQPQPGNESVVTEAAGMSPSGAGAGLQVAVGKEAAEFLEGDLMGALEGMTPAAFWGVHTQKSVQQGVSGWEDVGGMEDVRAALYEALELPTQYPELVAQAPLRLRTGVLLYGPPGCGKTHVVSAAVAAANVRCITVSGPELLNKYIGASEAAVRDVFQRASAAAPSVLFFDEFDAIAPQRGHDNTGVTDRVVNQLLTELDGVEGLKGVCVIAATSRPDLIDAALLRPGRLDRLMYCGFPTPLERGKILTALARSLTLAPDADLEQLAYGAENFSGADLSALLSEAQLAVVHETLEAELPPANGRSTEKQLHKHLHRAAPLISRRHLEVALSSARPSVPENERDRLERIYLKFQQSREPGGSGASVDKGKGKKVSWA